MSRTELHIGKLKPIQYNLSVEDFKNWLKDDESRYAEDLEEYLEEDRLVIIKQGDWRGKNTHIFSKNTLYEFLEHKDLGEADYLDITNKLEDGTIDFTYLFYNGGTCFSEMLEEGLAKI